MRFLFLAALVAVTASCGAYNFPSGSASQGTVTGRVVAVPCSPVQNPDNACTPRPAAGVEIDFTDGQGGELLTTKTGPDGAYSLQLPAGTWTVTLKTTRVMSGPSTVTVKAGAKTVADYVVDSGIRVPAPAA
jgi:hypothetical protein